MTEDQNISTWVKTQLKGAAPTVALLSLLLVLLLAISVVTRQILDKFDWQEVWYLLGLLVLICLLSTIAAAILARTPVERRLLGGMQEITHAASKLTQEAQAMSQLTEFLKGERAWLVDDIEVYRIEASADEAIDVVAPDLYYEEQPDYQDIISDNISRDVGPAYRYVVPNLSENRAQAVRVIEGLARRLTSNGVSDPTIVIRERFRVAFLDERDQFPSASLHGMAMYRWRDGRRQCLQYLPREFGALNINIPLPGNWDGEVKIGGRVVDAAKDEFERLFDTAKVQEPKV